MSVERHWKELLLTTEECREWKEFGRHLGFMDLEMQEKNMELYLEQLELSVRFYREQEREQQKLSISLGSWRSVFNGAVILKGGMTMGVNVIFRIAAVGILVSVLCQVLKHSGREEQAFLTSLAGLILVLLWMIPYIYELFDTIKNLFTYNGGECHVGSDYRDSGDCRRPSGSELKGLKGEYGIYLVAAVGLVIFFYGVTKLKTVIETIRQVQSYIRLNRMYLEVLLKMIGITYIAEFSSGICKDAGYGSLGSQIEIFGKLSVLAVSMPILLALLDTVQQFLA